MKKLLAILMSFTMLFTLVACGDSETESGKVKESSVQLPQESLPPGTTIYYNSRPESSKDTATSSQSGSSSQNVTSQRPGITIQSKPESSSEQTPTSSDTVNTETPTKYINYKFEYLANTYAKLTQDKKLNVAFMGGSVTDGTGASNPKNDGWPRLVCKHLADAYGANVVENRKSIGGTGSYFGAFRYTNDIGGTAKQQPDLLFIEFAINDSYIGESYDQVVKNSESIVRKALSLNPKMDIVYVLTFDKGTKNADYEQLKAHKAVAEKYGFLCINLRELLGETIDFKANFADDVHPNTKGYETYGNMIGSMILSYMPNLNDGIARVTPKNKVLPKTPMSDYYKNLKLVKSNKINLSKSTGWVHSGNGFSYVGGSYGGKLVASKGAKLVFEFTGSELALVYDAGTNGKVSVTVDGGAATEINANYSYSNPKTARIPISKNGKHKVEVTVTEGNFEIAAYTFD